MARKASPPPSPNCTRCGEPVHPLEVFPGNICLPCYRPTGDRIARTMTATDLARMWGAR